MTNHGLSLLLPADDFVDPDEKAFEYLNDRRLYSTLNPRLGLYSPSSIDHVGPNMPNGPKLVSIRRKVSHFV